MKLRIITLRQSTVREVGAVEKIYLERLKHAAKVELVDIKPESGRAKSSLAALKEDGKRILEKVDENGPVVVLDSGGRSLTSEALADWLKVSLNHGSKSISFIIGSAEGLDEEVKKRANLKLKISDLTLPHQLVRLILLEALYRSFDILGPKRYHK